MPIAHKNYDLSISEAPKLYTDGEFEAAKRIKQGLAVLLLRKRLKVLEETPSMEPQGDLPSRGAKIVSHRRRFVPTTAEEPSETMQ